MASMMPRAAGLAAALTSAPAPSFSTASLVDALNDVSRSARRSDAYVAMALSRALYGAWRSGGVMFERAR